MKPNVRRSLSGVFSPSDLGNGVWRITRSAPPVIDVYLQGAEAAAAEVLGSATVTDMEVEWRGGTVALTLRAAERQRTLRAQSAIVHEPLPRLYEALPLVSFDAAARRFWRRVFRLVRIPGGRYLLRVLARRT